MSLNKEQLNELEKRLLEIKSETEKRLQGIKKSRDYGDDVDGFDEETDEAEEFANTVQIERALNDKLHKINDLMARVKEGDYGVCKKCESGMGYEFLKENPDSQMCLKCKPENDKNSS